MGVVGGRFGPVRGNGRGRVRSGVWASTCGRTSRCLDALKVAGLVGAAVVSAWALAVAFVPSASADPCPDVQVVFARGTDEPPGVGPTGQAFVDSLRPRVGARSFDVYPVNYPARMSGARASTAFGMRARMSFRWHTTVPRPRWCSAA